MGPLGRSSIEKQKRRRLSRSGGPGPPPTLYHFVDVQRAEACRRPLDHRRVHFGDLRVERGNPAANGRFVGELLDRGELLLNLAEQLKRWRQLADLLALHEFLDPPKRVERLIQIRERLAGPRQVVESA